jgi:hypothetical protein
MKTNTYFTGIGPAGATRLWTRGVTTKGAALISAKGNGRDDLPPMPAGARVLFLASDHVDDGREWHDALFVDDDGEWQRKELDREAAKAWLRELPKD